MVATTAAATTAARASSSAATATTTTKAVAGVARGSTAGRVPNLGGPLRRTAVPGSAAALIGQARLVLSEAAATPDVGERFRLAHLAALRVAAALLAERGRPAAVRRRLVSVWMLIDAVAPEFTDWAGYFAAGAAARAAVEAGSQHAVSGRDADDQLRAAEEFLLLAEQSLGMLAAPLAS